MSRYQMPAKVTDAMAMGVPCLVTPVPPLQPLIDKDVIEVFDGDMPLEERLRDFFANPEDAADRARRAREVFLESYSYAAVRPVVASTIEGHLDDPPPLTPGLKSIVRVARDLFKPSHVSAVRERGPRRPMPAGSTYDLVVFWKQNDTGIYGRRQDMFLKYLERSGRFAKIVHFDHPMSVEGLSRTAQRGIGSGDQNRLVAQQTLRRMIHREDRGARPQPDVRVRGAARATQGDEASAPVAVPRRTSDRCSSDEGIGKDRPVVFWVYPTNTFFPKLVDRLAPDIVVADVVDDNRTWYAPGTPDVRQARSENYAQGARAQRRRARELRSGRREHARVRARGARGAERVRAAGRRRARGDRPRELPGSPDRSSATPATCRTASTSSCSTPRRGRGATGTSCSSARPISIGPALDLADEPNVRLIGTKRYDEAQAIISHFDVALIPHLDNEMSRSMNPLKAYVYCSLGVPIVSTPVANLDQLAEFITFADGPDEFVAAIESALRPERRMPDREHAAAALVGRAGRAGAGSDRRAAVEQRRNGGG